MKDLEKYYGNSRQFELRTGMSHSNWPNWRKWGYIPIVTQMKLQLLTDGLLMADFDDIPQENFR